MVASQENPHNLLNKKSSNVCTRKALLTVFVLKCSWTTHFFFLYTRLYLIGNRIVKRRLRWFYCIHISKSVSGLDAVPGYFRTSYS